MLVFRKEKTRYGGQNATQCLTSLPAKKRRLSTHFDEFMS